MNPLKLGRHQDSWRALWRTFRKTKLFFEFSSLRGDFIGLFIPISMSSLLFLSVFSFSHADAYEFTVIFEGVLGEAAKVLSLRGEGSFDGQYEATYNVWFDIFLKLWKMETTLPFCDVCILLKFSD